MFSYRLPNPIESLCFMSPEGDVRFEPKVYQQRYLTTTQILEDERWTTQIKKVVDFGCADMKLFKLLRRNDHIEHIMEVDIDGNLLEYAKKNTNPLISDHLQNRENPLLVEVYQGSIDSSVECLLNTDAVIALEIIEHLYPNILENVPYNIFGYIQPKLAIISTPNADFNILFSPLANGFRHLDHKFEWSRKQFKDWAMNICKRFPNYHYTILGIGKAPPDYKSIGCVSQMAIFVRNDILHKKYIQQETPLADLNPEKQYEIIHSVDFPFKKDQRTLEEKINDETQYQIYNCRIMDRYFNSELYVYEIPISHIKKYIERIGGTENQLNEALIKNKYKIENNFIIVSKYNGNDEDSNHSNLADDYDDQDDDGGYCNFDATNESEEEWE